MHSCHKPAQQPAFICPTHGNAPAAMSHCLYTGLLLTCSLIKRKEKPEKQGLLTAKPLLHTPHQQRQARSLMLRQHL
jgi:hypothetical protein